MNYKYYLSKAQQGAMVRMIDKVNGNPDDNPFAISQDEIDAVSKKYGVLPDDAKLLLGAKFLKGDKQRGLQYLNSIGMDYKDYRDVLDNIVNKYNIPVDVKGFMGTANQEGNKSYQGETLKYADRLFPVNKKTKQVPYIDYEMIEKEVGGDFFTPEDIYQTPTRTTGLAKIFEGKKRPNAVKVSGLRMTNDFSGKNLYSNVNDPYNLQEILGDIGIESKVKKGKDIIWGRKQDHVYTDEELTPEQKKQMAEELNKRYFPRRKVTQKIPIEKMREEEYYEPAFQKGGMIKGMPHEMGGEEIMDEEGNPKVEAEGGEIIFSAEASQQIDEYVNQAMNIQDENTLVQIAQQLGMLILQERVNQMQNEQNSLDEQMMTAQKGKKVKKRLDLLNEI